MNALILLASPLLVFPVQPPQTVTTFAPNGIVVTNAGERVITTYSKKGIEYTIVGKDFTVNFDKDGKVQPVILYGAE